MKMNFELRTDFTTEESDSLWSQGVSLDDWDVALITFNLTEFETTEDTFIDYDEKGNRVAVTRDVYSPKLYEVSQLLQGCCDNRWHKITWQGKEAVIGLAYHA